MVSCFVLFMAGGQNIDKSFNLSEELSGEQVYEARDEIRLSSNFSYTASDGVSFHGYINPLLVFTPTDNTYIKEDGTFTNDPTLGYVVGAIPGQLSVSPMGGAIYSLPIECPKGINGMDPSVSLTYNSQNGNGIVGVGWSIGGLSSISRTVATPFYNDVAEGYNWTSSSPLMLDGQRLIVISETEDEIEYKTESESFSKIIGQGIQDWGPETIKVYSKDGKIFTYGNSESIAAYMPLTSTKYMGWLLTKVEDSHQNTINYTYTYSTSESTYYNHRISQIDYGANELAATSNYATIIFNYEDRDDEIISYVDGCMNKIDLLLSSIEVCSSSHKNKSYAITYSTDIDTQPHIQSVKLTGENQTSLKPTNFEIGALNQEIESSEVEMPDLPSGIDEDDIYWFSSDVNKDGLSDLIAVYTKENTDGSFNKIFKVYKSVVDEENNVTFSADNSYITSLVDLEYSSFKFRSGVFNKVLLTSGLPPSLYLPYLNTYSNDGNEWCTFCFYDLEGETLISELNSYSTEMPAFSFGDLNNDGFSEAFYIENVKKDGVYPGKIFWGRTLGSDPETEVEFTLDSAPEKIYCSDFNNDGLKDLLIITKNGSKFYKNIGGALGEEVVEVTFEEVTFDQSDLFADSGLSEIKEGDFNGDGLLDFIINEKNTASWTFLINDGNWGFSENHLDAITAQNESFTNLNEENDQCVVYDFDNDGKDDVVIIEADYDEEEYVSQGKTITRTVFSSFYVAWFKSTGDNVTLIGQVDSDNEDYSINQKTVLGDFNGDGRVDLLSINSDLFGSSNTDDNIHIVSTPKSDGERLVKSITNGIGLKNVVDYKSLTKEEVYTQGVEVWSKGIYNLTLPLDVVYQVTTPEDNSEDEVIRYNYEEAYFHIGGKGFLGYKYRTIENLRNGFKTEYINTLDKDYFLILPYKTKNIIVSSDNSEETISEQIIVNTIVDQGDGRYWLKPNYNSELDYDNNVYIETTYSSFDAAGNSKFINKSYYNGSDKTGDRIKYERQNLTFVQAGSWCLNKPSVVKVTNNYNSENYIRTKNYTYDSETGNILTETIDPGETNPVVTEYSNYDSFGNPWEVSVTANAETRSTSYEYSTSGRFLTKETHDFTDFSTSYVYDEETGLLTSVTQDHLSLTTTYEYDNLGRLSNTNYPDGSSKVSAFQWAGDDYPDGAQYFVYNESSGTSPVWTWYDKYNRVLREDQYGLDTSTKILVSKSYNDNGMLESVSLPYFDGDEMISAKSYTYDTRGRIKTLTTPAGVTSYGYESKKFTINTPNGDVKIITKDGAGQTITSSLNGRTVTYSYYPSGLVKSALPQGGSAITNVYDLQGNRISITDPDAGEITSEYNGFGELLWQEHTKTEDGEEVTIRDTYTYDNAGRTISSVLNGLTTTTEYDTETGFISSISNEDHTVSYLYDEGGIPNLGRVTTETEELEDGSTFSYKYEYDAIGREKKRTYPSGFYVKNKYNSYGQLTEVKTKDNVSVWKAVSTNALGQYLETLKGAITTEFSYTNDRYLPESIKAGDIFEQNYLFSDEGNLIYRDDAIFSQHEVFSYTDENNMLYECELYKDGVYTSGFTMGYDEHGNITEKSDVGFAMNYEHDEKIHALTSISGNPDLISEETQEITYTDFKKVKSISEGNKELQLSYGIDNQRRIAEYFEDGSLEYTRYYQGDYEEEVYASGEKRKVHYIIGGDGIAAIYIETDGTGLLYYAITDYLGSLVALTNSDGTIAELNGTEQRFAYDAWGNRRDPENWNNKLSDAGNLLVDRGYTMHEHLDNFALINMNGRVYDPTIARFLSPDPQLQAPDNWLNYNRYAYCNNNPFLYTDPSGENPLLLIAICAAIYGVANLSVHAIRGDIDNFGDGLRYFGQGALVGAALGAAWAFAPLIPVVGNGIQTTMEIYAWVHAGGAALSGVSGLGQGLIAGDWRALGNAGKIFLGNFYIDENRSFLSGVWEGFSRHTWQFIQTGIGGSYSQLRNTFGAVDRVDYLGGATFVTSENSDKENGVSLGSFVNINLSDEIDDDFTDYVISHPIYMHEYGHYIDSQSWGLSYIFAIGIPSILSAEYSDGTPISKWEGKYVSNLNNLRRHQVRKYEMRANKNASKYFGKYYDVNWDDYPDYPTEIPW